MTPLLRTPLLRTPLLRTPLLRTPLLRTLAASLLTTTACLMVACGDDGSSGGGSGGAPPVIPDVLYEAQASDEALAALLAATPSDAPTEAAYRTSPSEGAALGASSPEAFEWRVGPTEARWAPGAPEAVRFGAARHPPSEGSRTSALPGWLISAPVEVLMGPALSTRRAYAHGPPVNGRAYYLVVQDANGAIVHHVFTLDLRHTPSSEAWALLAAAEGPLRVSVTNAIFEDNRILEDGGPFVGPAVSFSID
jgi:hypothetical protein